MSLFDAHCHLENERFSEDFPDVMERMAENGVTRCILAGSDMPTSRQITKLSCEHANIYGVVGIHPHEAKTWTDEDADELSAMQSHARIVGIGEIGLDYFYDFSPRETQKEVLVRQLLLAKSLNVPVVFHVRDAHGDMLDVLRAHRGELPAGMVHCYSGSVESAREYLSMGFYLSFAGPITFKNANKIQEAVKYCPEDRLMVETDSPYLAPVPMRGRRNEPSFVRFVAQKAAELRGVDVESLCETAARNTCRLFGISEAE